MAIKADSQLGADLSEEEVGVIAAFLRWLTGEVPEVVCPILPPETAAAPRPSGRIIT